MHVSTREGAAYLASLRKLSSVSLGTTNMICRDVKALGSRPRVTQLQLAGTKNYRRFVKSLSSFPKLSTSD